MNLAVLAMLAAVSCFSVSTVGSKYLLSFLSFAQISALRFAIAALLMWGVVLWRNGGRIPRFNPVRPLLLGLMEPGTVSLLFVLGLTQTSATHGAVLWGLMPILAPWFARFLLGERLTWVNYVSSALAVSGAAMLLVLDDGRTSSLYGDLLCAAAVILSSLAALLARRIATDRGAAIQTTATQLTAAGILGFVMVGITQPETSYVTLPGSVWLIFLPWILIAGAAPFFLYNYGMRHLPIARMALFPPLVAPMGTAMAALWLGEPIHISVILAIVLILSAVALSTQVKKSLA